MRCSRPGRTRCASSARAPRCGYVLIFENKGEVVGVSNPHPHCQIYATNFVFKYIETELRRASAIWPSTGRVLFQDVLAAERQDGRRILSEQGSAIAFVPYFARYAYEVYVAPHASAATLATLDDAERRIWRRCCATWSSASTICGGCPSTGAWCSTIT